MQAIQDIVDALAARIGQPVGVDDRHYRAVAYSPHVGEVDEVRRASILTREAPVAAREHLETLRLDRAEGAVAIAAHPDVGMAARVCVPIRFDGLLTGFLWLLGGPHAHSPATMRTIDESLGELGAELYRGRRLADDRRSREAALVDALVRATGDAELAAVELVAGGMATASRYVVMVAVCGDRSPTLGPREREVGFGIAVERLRRGMRSRQMTASVTAHEAVVVAGLEGEDLARWATALSAAVAEHLDTTAGGIVVGIGAPRDALGDLRAAYREAVAATRVAGSVGTAGAPAFWPRLGAYRGVAELLGDRDPLTLIPQSLRLLLDDPDAHTLVQTAESYLEHAGDAQAAAGELFIHRSSLYNRLHRIQEVGRVDLRSGDDRLELHLGIRLWRLASGAGPVDLAGRPSWPPSRGRVGVAS